MKAGRTVAIAAITLGGVVVLCVLAALIFIYSGAYNVAATEPHGHIMAWALDETMESSVEARAKSVSVPANFASLDLREGVQHFQGMCVTCHGAPGIERDEIGEGLYPDAPSLSKFAGDWTPAQLYWIIKNGIKDTGMPAFGKTHTEEQLWAITALVAKLPQTNEQQYKQWVSSSGGESEPATRP